MQAAKNWRRTLRRFLRPALPDTPESLLIRAQTEMREAEGRHRRRMVEAVTEKNHLQQQVNDTEARVTNFHNKALLAEQRGDDELARKLRHESEPHEKLLVLMQEKMAQSEAITEHLKQTFHLRNEVFRQQITEALTLQVQYQMSVLQKKLADALIGEASDTPAQRRTRERARQLLLPDAQKREKEFAALVEVTEKEVAGLRAQLTRARAKKDEAAERVLVRELDDEEKTLSLLRDAHDRARDVRERAKRWVGVVPNPPTEKENV